MIGEKRKHDDSSNSLVASKKQKTINGGIVIRDGNTGTLVPAGIKRTSNLSEPIMQLGNHKGEVYTTKFSPDGKTLASGSFDKNIFFWEVYGECDNYNVLSGHKNAVLDVQYSMDGLNLYSASADKTCISWDLKMNTRSRRFREHTSIINHCNPARRGPELIATASDDSTAKIWDIRSKKSITTIKHSFPVTSVSFSDNSSKLYTAGLDGNIYCWDLSTNELEYTMKGHSEIITNISLSPDGNSLLSNSQDNTVRMWDVKPFISSKSENGRELKVFHGVMHNYESNLLKCSWSPDGKRISAGSADKFVYVWDVLDGKLLYKLPGHKGSVNEVVFHPNEPIIASCSSDRTIFLGEITN